jgi:methyl-accepting chemotaxis protein
MSSTLVMLRDLPIITKLSAIFGTIALLALIIVGCILFHSISASGMLENVKSDSAVVDEKLMPLTTTIGDIQRDVIQVQQFLTDISATRGEDGLDDGFEDAKKFAQSFHQNVARAHKIANQLGDQKLIASLDNVEKAFTPYYKTGQVMAHAFINGGTSNGNRTMRQFDDDSLVLQASV